MNGIRQSSVEPDAEAVRAGEIRGRGCNRDISESGFRRRMNGVNGPAMSG